MKPLYNEPAMITSDFFIYLTILSSLSTNITLKNNSYMYPSGVITRLIAASPTHLNDVYSQSKYENNPSHSHVLDF